MQDDDNKPNKAETYDEGHERILVMYELMLVELAVARNTINEELTKSPPDPHYLMGQERLNVALENAVEAIENCGVLEEDEFRCHHCVELVLDHDDDGDDGTSGGTEDNVPSVTHKHKLN